MVSLTVLGFVGMLGYTAYHKLRTAKARGESLESPELVASEYGASVRRTGDHVQLRLQESGAVLMVSRRLEAGGSLIIVEARGGPLPASTGLQLRVSRKISLSKLFSRAPKQRAGAVDRFDQEWEIESSPAEAARHWLVPRVRAAIAAAVNSQLVVEHAFVQVASIGKRDSAGSDGTLACGIHMLRALAAQGQALVTAHAELAHSLDGTVVRPFCYAERDHKEVATFTYLEAGNSITARVYVSKTGMMTALACAGKPPCAPFTLVRAASELSAEWHCNAAIATKLGVEVLPHGEHWLLAADTAAARGFVQQSVRPGYESYGKRLCAVVVSENSAEFFFEGYVQDPELYRRSAAVLVDLLRAERAAPYR